jgi:hypothetical protein
VTARRDRSRERRHREQQQKKLRQVTRPETGKDRVRLAPRVEIHTTLHVVVPASARSLCATDALHLASEGPGKDALLDERMRGGAERHRYDGARTLI